MKVEIKKSEICVTPKAGNKIEVLINRPCGSGGGEKLFFAENQFGGTGDELDPITLDVEFIKSLTAFKTAETSGNKVWGDAQSYTYFSDISASAYTITLNSGITKPILLFQKSAVEGTFAAGSVTLVGDDLKTTQNDAVMVYPFSDTEYHIIHLDKSKGGGGVGRPREQDLGLIDGNVQIDLSLGTHVIATLDDAVTLSFTGLPPAGEILEFTLNFTNIKEINWPVGTTVFNGGAPMEVLSSPYTYSCHIDSFGNLNVWGVAEWA